MIAPIKQPTLTVKQRERLAELEDIPNVRMVGWHSVWRGPIVQFSTGARFVITRDGGLLKQ